MCLYVYLLTYYFMTHHSQPRLVTISYLLIIKPLSPSALNPLRVTHPASTITPSSSSLKLFFFPIIPISRITILPSLYLSLLFIFHFLPYHNTGGVLILPGSPNEPYFKKSFFGFYSFILSHQFQTSLINPIYLIVNSTNPQSLSHIPLGELVGWSAVGAVAIEGAPPPPTQKIFFFLL